MRSSPITMAIAAGTIAAATPALRAQATAAAPSATTPSVISDTIYHLAVDSAKYPEDDHVYLLDEGIVRLDAEGRGTRTVRQVIQILKDDAAQYLSEQQFSYSPGHERMTLNWIRVVKPDGTVISNGPSHVQDADIPAQMGNPVYSDRKVKRISLTGLKPGTIVDYSITTEELKPYLPGDFFESWSFMSDAPVLRSRYVLDLPDTVTPHLLEHGHGFTKQTRTQNGRTVYTWTAHDIPRIKGERFAADSNDVYMYLEASAPTTWAHIAQWYATNARDRYVASPALAHKVDQLVAHASTLNDSIEAVHRWVAQDIRYVAIALGMGGYQPRPPDTVYATGFGDCKDKATLFITAMQHLGVTAYPVLLNSFGKVFKDLPSYLQFDHVIAAVNTPAGYRYTDLTAEFTPYGEIPSSYQGEFGLVVFPNGASQEITFPKAKLTDNLDSTVLVGALDTAGYFSGSYYERARGTVAEALRGIFQAPLDSTQRAHFAKAIANRYFEDADGDSLVAFNGKDLQAIPAYSAHITRGRAAVAAGDMLILTIPPGEGVFTNRIADVLSSAPPRKFPIDAERVLGPLVAMTDIRITLPEGWQAKLPTSVHVSGPFGTYTSDYTQTGRVLRIVRRSEGAEGIYPPDRINDLETWLREIGKDNVRFIALERKSATSR